MVDVQERGELVEAEQVELLSASFAAGKNANSNSFGMVSVAKRSGTSLR